jgi:tetratricopeptide (TPR) repeat protein/predicted Ser/Thr protein kinase
LITPERTALRLGHYVLLHTLGRGGMGIVYAAYDERLDRRVAIKLLHKRGREKAGRRLIREAQALARLSHPNVVPIHDVGEFEQQPFLVMDLIEGVTLDQWRAERERTRDEILAVFLAAGRGLAAAHAKGVIHRDFKPENVMIRRDGQVVVMDFGLARGDDRSDSPLADEPSELPAEPGQPAEPIDLLAEAEDMPIEDSSESGRRPRASELQRSLTAVGTILGTPGYMAPEQVFGQDVSEHCDQFSFCAALWEALYDTRPFAGRSIAAFARAVRRDRPRPNESNDVPMWLRSVLERGLALEPANRWPSMNALLEALQRDPTKRRRRVSAAAGLLVCACSALAGLYFADERERERLASERAEQLSSCAREGEEIVADWTELDALEIEQAFLTTKHPFAESAWQHTRPWLDGFAREWSVVRARTCVEATVEHVRSADSQASVNDCLDEARIAFVGVLDVLSGLAAEDAQMVTNATMAAARLPQPSNCTNPSLLRQLRRPPAELRDEITDLRVRLERARARSYAGDHTRGLAEAEAALAEAEALAWSPMTTQAGSLVALLQFRLGEFEAAKLASERAVLLAAASDDGLGMLMAASELSAALGGLANYDDARRWGLFGEALVDRLELGGTTYEAQVLTRLAAVLAEMGATEQALPRQQRALVISETVLGPEHPSVALVLLNLGVTRDKLGEHRAALDAFNRGIEIVKAVQGPEHLNLGYLYNSVATTRKTLGDLEGAFAAQQRALAIWEATFGSEHPTVALAQANLGAMLCDRDQCEEALVLHERALATLEAKHGPDHPQVATTHKRIGTALCMLGSHDEALEHHHQALRILEASKGAEHQDVLRIRIQIAEVLYEQGHAAQAIEQLRLALEVLERTPGSALVIGEALVQLGLALLETGELAAAREQLERALPLFAQTEGGVERAEAQLALARVLWADGDRVRAQTLTAQAQEGYRAAGEFGTRGLAKLETWLRARSEQQARGVDRHADQHQRGQ